ncbi:MAG: LysM peptidoglycan-binding domain-containing protein [Bacillota bacterium]
MEPARTVAYFIVLVLLFLGHGPKKAVAVPPENPSLNYRVGAGDTLDALAGAFEVSKEQIKRWNGLSSEELQKGQDLIIAPPAFARPVRGMRYKVEAGDTLTGIARRSGLSSIDLICANNLQGDALSPGQELWIPAVYRGREDLARNYTGEEWLLMAKIIRAEAKGEPEDGLVAVGGVVANRLLNTYFPNTVAGVIFQPGQFTPAAGGLNVFPDLPSYIAAKRALNGEDPSRGALYFSNLEKAQQATIEMFGRLTVTVVIGRHTFAK